MKKINSRACVSGGPVEKNAEKFPSKKATPFLHIKKKEVASFFFLSLSLNDSLCWGRTTRRRTWWGESEESAAASVLLPLVYFRARLVGFFGE